MKYNVWHIDAYEGWSDYDGPSDCNIHKDIVMDAKFTREQVVSMFLSTLEGRTSVVSKCSFVSTGEIEIPIKE